MVRAAWAEERGMRTFLSVAAGSEEPCKFLEIHYKGSKNGSAKSEFKPSLALVGKGITFGAPTCPSRSLVRRADVTAGW